MEIKPLWFTVFFFPRWTTADCKKIKRLLRTEEDGKTKQNCEHKSLAINLQRVSENYNSKRSHMQAVWDSAWRKLSFFFFPLSNKPSPLHVCWAAQTMPRLAAPRQCVHPDTPPRSSPLSAALPPSANGAPAPPAWPATGWPGWTGSPVSPRRLYKTQAGVDGKKQKTKGGDGIFNFFPHYCLKFIHCILIIIDFISSVTELEEKNEEENRRGEE